MSNSHDKCTVRLLKNKTLTQAWWHVPLIPAEERGKITKLWVEPLVGALTKSSLSSHLLLSWAHSVLQACSPSIAEGANLKMDSMACGTQLPHLQWSIIWALLLGYIIGSTSQDSELGYLWSEPSFQVYHREHSSDLWISSDRTVKKSSHCEHHWRYPPIIRLAYALGDSSVQKPAGIAPPTLSSSHYPLWTTGLK